MSRAVSIRVHGTVQGVWFRDSTRRRATELGLTGFVRNESDGSVSIEAHGDDAAVGQLIEWCHTGPPDAKVQRVDVTESSASPCQDFQIQR
jgi:acylphosphatase